MEGGVLFEALVAGLRASPGLAAKADIGTVAAALGLDDSSAIRVGDDCAAIPDRDGFLLFAIEGFMNAFVARDPWFAGWCGVMVNLSDIAAMGGRPVAVVNALWADRTSGAAPILDGLKAASAQYGVPIVGGHCNLKTDRGQFAAAVLGRATRLLTSFDARPGEVLVAAVDLRGRYREPFSNWNAATDAPEQRLRGDLDVLPAIAEAGLCRAAKDISQGGLIGTAAMLAECSRVGIAVDLDAVPRPDGVALDRWLQTFPSYGYILSVAPPEVPAVIGRFTARGLAAAAVGRIDASREVSVTRGAERAVICDFSRRPLIRGVPETVAARDDAERAA